MDHIPVGTGAIALIDNDVTVDFSHVFGILPYYEVLKQLSEEVIDSAEISPDDKRDRKNDER